MMTARIFYADLWGMREGKYRSLIEADISVTEWAELKPSSPFYLFVPFHEDLLAEYEQGWKVTEVFSVNSVGIVTARDDLTIKWTAREVEEIIKDFASLPAEEAREKYSLGKDARDWKVELAQKDLKDSDLSSEKIVTVLYRPFDSRYTYYTGHSRGFHCMPRGEVMRHMLAGENLGLISARSNKSQNMDHFLCSRFIVETKCGESTTQSCFFPLYLYPAEGEMQFDGGKRRPNLNPEFIAEVERRLGMKFEPHRQSPSEVEKTLGMKFEPHPLAPSPLTERGTGGEVIDRWRTSPELWEKLKPLARQMRKQPTEAENVLWQHLRDRRLLGFKFRRQHAIERFIVDFYCSAAGLVLEIDGPIHQYSKEEDLIRHAYIESQGLRVLRFTNDAVLHNLDEVLSQISSALTSPSPSTERGLGGEVAKKEQESEVFTPEDIFNYAYAVFHSPTYRTRYAEFLKIDFPRLPVTSDRGLFRSLAEKGAELVSLHLMESPELVNFITRYPIGGTNEVEKVTCDVNDRRVYINKTQYFEGVPQEVWDFHVGGYQVCQKWLKDRKGRILTYDELTHYQKVVVALKETIRLMGEIDEVIDQHGGWPEAFITEST